MDDSDGSSILDKLDSVVPAQLQKFDAFPKLPATYKQRSESRGFLTLFVGFLTFLLILNDIGEFIWGWPDYEFSVDATKDSYMSVNMDMVVQMPCQYLSVDLRDAVGDRLYLSKGFRRDGTTFDHSQATSLKEHAAALSARQAIAQSRKSRGLFGGIFGGGSKAPAYRPTYNNKPDSSSCRIYGSLNVKKVTANLHITTAGHGYTSHQHVDHTLMNLSHIINEFSFGPYFPDITQPLDYSYEIANDGFVAYQYYMHVVPTTYIAPRSAPLHTNQYSVTHYVKQLEVHSRPVPGIFFKFDLDPMRLTIHQRTTSFPQLLIRCVGVIGGIFVCMGYAIRITSRAVNVVSADPNDGTIAAEASGVRPGGLRAKWGGSQLHARKTSTARVVRQGNGWTVEGGESPYPTSPAPGSYLGTPSPYSSPYASSPALPPASPYLSSPGLPPAHGSVPPSPSPAQVGLGLGSPSVYSPAANGNGYPSRPSSMYGMPDRTPSGGHAYFPPTPNPANGNGNGFSPGHTNGAGQGSISGPPPARSRKDSGKDD
ncbi:hypothetical protein HWV62_18652 [Athelia sp. TMB]|nr:hypothetical protein HWV62_18652 [Athelia sp. TMB]